MTRSSSSGGVTRPSVVLAVALVLTTAGCAGVTGVFSGEGWGFEEVSEETGLVYEAQASGVGNGNSGVYVSDVDNDGWPDVLAIGGEEPALFSNTGGEFERSDALPEVNVSVQGALFFDADGDGWEDLLLLPREGNAVFLSNDGGTFRVAESGLAVPMEVAVGASAADYDADGDLDVFVIQYGNWADGVPEGYLDESGYVSPDNGNPNLLFENTDDGFERVTDAGVEGAHWSLATSFVDLTGDGRPDVHVANDFNNDTLYVNDGDGTFDRRPMGVETARNGMSSEVGDVNGDGRPDLFVTNIYFPIEEANLTEEHRQRLRRYFSFVLRSKRIEGNNLLVNRGEGRFTPAAVDHGVREGGWGWASVLADLDNDGSRDLFHATQRVVRMDDEDPHYTYPMIWTREGDGFESRDASDLGFSETDGRGVASLDYDRDGDLDLVVSTFDDRFRVYENDAGGTDGRNALQVQVVEENGESTALGAKVSVTVDGSTSHAVQHARSDYQSQDSRVLHFGLGSSDRVDRIEAVWPDGTSRTFTDVEANRRIAITPEGELRTVPNGES